MNILLIMPNFFDYPEEICKELEMMGHSVDYFDDRPSTNSIVKAIIRVRKNLINIYIRSYFKKVMKIIKTKKYDVVFLISGQSLSFDDEMLSELKESQVKAKFVLYQWDSLRNFPSIQTIRKYFDKCYSFDREDVVQNGDLKFLPLFYTRRYENIGREYKCDYKYDLSFVGTAHPKKYKFINLMSNQLKKIYSKQYIYFFFPSRIIYFYRKFCNPELRKAKYHDFHYTPINRNEMGRIISESKCILDSPQAGQIGLTIRVLEALGAKKKIITTNKDIVNYDFYKEENIYVYDGEFDYSSKFFKSIYCEIEKEFYEKYALRNWLKEILL